MSKNATELAVIGLVPGANIEDPNSSAGTVWQDTLTTVLDQDGAQRAYWGRQVENPSVLHLFVDWDSVEHHHKFMNQTYYEAFRKRLSTLCDPAGPFSLYHANLTPHPATAALSNINAPATEILTAFFPASYSQADQDKFEQDIKTLVGVIEKNADGYKGSAGGWIVEEPENEKARGKSKAYFAAIGWESVEAHLKFREHQAFKDNISLLREAKDLKDLNVVHASLLEVQGSIGAEERGELGAGAANPQEEILNPQNPGPGAPKTAADGSTSKNDAGEGGVGNSLKKERAGRGQ